MERLALAVAIKKHLMLPGEKFVDILKQIKQLTPADKNFLMERFRVEGIAGII